MAQTAREEAERLVATVLAVAERTGVLRDPDPRLAERLATGAGELATSVAGMMRALSSMAGGSGRSSRPRPASPPSRSDAWSSATDAPPGEPNATGQDLDPESVEASEREPWSTATRESNRAAEAAAVAARAARQSARLAEEAARRAQEKADEAAWHARRRTEDAARRTGGGVGRPTDVWAAATEPIQKAAERIPEVEPIEKAAAERIQKADPVPKAEGVQKSGLAGKDAVDHDGAGSAAGAGDAGDAEVDD